MAKKRKKNQTKQKMKIKNEKKCNGAIIGGVKSSVLL